MAETRARPAKPRGKGAAHAGSRVVAPLRIGCAGWSIPARAREHFGDAGTHLQRYASTLGAAEINSSFHRPHRPQTYEKWAASVPAGFRFAVKLPREITHEHGLIDCDDLLDAFLGEIAGLGDKLGPLLVQLPPSFEHDTAIVSAFFRTLRRRFPGDVVCEPRHPSWAGPDAEALLADLRVARVAADPPRGGMGSPGGWAGLAYHRLHGSPDVYWSSYADRLPAIADALAAHPPDVRVWCIFDNTAGGAAFVDAAVLSAQVKVKGGGHA